MNILFCNYEYPPLGGGGGVATAAFAEELAKRHEVVVLTSQCMHVPADERINGVRVIRVPVYFRSSTSVANVPSMLSYIPAAIRAGKDLVQSWHVDVITTHFVLPTGPVGDVLSRYAGVPNVLFVHGGDLYDPSKWLSPHRHLVSRIWVRTLLRRADRVVGQSRNTIANIGRYYTDGIDAVRIPLGLSRPGESTADRAAYGLAEGEILFVTVGRLVPRKALGQIIHMMGALRGELARLLIIGSGPEEPRLRHLARSKNVDDRVHFMGQVEEAEKFRLLRMCDLYVSSSQHEGFGIVFLEAMACGLPVVCYDHGGQTDFLTDGVTGYLVPLNDLPTLTERCRTLVRDESLRRRMSDLNLSEIEKYFIERVTQKYERVFEDVILARAEGSLGYASRA